MKRVFYSDPSYDGAVRDGTRQAVDQELRCLVAEEDINLFPAVGGTTVLERNCAFWNAREVKVLSMRSVNRLELALVLACLPSVATVASRRHIACRRAAHTVASRAPGHGSGLHTHVQV